MDNIPCHKPTEVISYRYPNSNCILSRKFVRGKTLPTVLIELQLIPSANGNIPLLLLAGLKLPKSSTTVVGHKNELNFSMMTSSNRKIFLHAQRPVTQSFDVFFDMCPNKRLSKQSWSWWFQTPSRPLLRHCNVFAEVWNKYIVFWTVFASLLWPVMPSTLYESITMTP